MALKKLTILFTILIIVIADDLCSCLDDKTEHDIEEFRAFLLNLPTKVQNDHKYPVVPGEISPLVPCSNCIEKNINKRSVVQTKVLAKLRLFNRFGKDDSRNRCPVSYYRLGHICVKKQ